MEEMNLNNIVETGYEAAKKSKGGVIRKVVWGVGAALLAAAGVYAYKKRKNNEVEDEGCEETEDEE